MSEIVIIVLLLITGIISGFINTIAGGGSILVFLILLLIGIPSTVANATNRVSIFAQSAIATVQFGRARVLAPAGAGKWGREWLSIGGPALVGAAIGSLVAVELPVKLFDIALAVILLLLIVGLFVKPKQWLEEHPPRGAWWLRIPIFFLIGIYGGFAQAGLGLLLIPTLSLLLGYNVVRVNALKVSIIVGMSALSLIIFGLSDLVLWRYGLLLAAGSIVGAHLGVRFALRRGVGAIRWIIAIMSLLSVLRLLFPLLQERVQ